jgi:hypothetical protein
MTIIAFRVFGGEIPRLPNTMLPENASWSAINCDLGHGDLRGFRGDNSWSSATSWGLPIKSIYTEDGIYFYGWPWDVYPVRSMVVGDIHRRIYYTITLPDGPLAKVGRTHRNDSGTFTRVIGNPGPPANPQSGFVPQFWPPEVTTAGAPGGINGGTDSWVLGVPAPKVMADIEEDNLPVTLEDRNEWPGAPGLQLRVTLFYEAPSGEIVYQQDISNYDLATVDGLGNPVTWRNVFYSTDANRGNKAQDMNYAMDRKQRPYKYYFFLPPVLPEESLARAAIVVNNGPAEATFQYTTLRAVGGGGARPPVQVA